MNVTPWFPPRLAGVSGPAWNALVSYEGHAFPLVAKGTTAVFHLAPAPDPSAPCVKIEPTRGPTLYLLWKSFPFRAMFGVDLSVDDLAAMPPALREALSEGMVSLVWSAIPEQQLGGFQIGAIAPLNVFLDGGEHRNLGWFSLAMNAIAPEPITLLVGCERDALLRVFADGLVAPQRVHAGLKAKLSAEATFTLGRLPLPIHELKALTAGAIVVLSAVEPDDSTVRVERATYRFRANGKGWICQGAEDVGPTGGAAGLRNGDRMMDSVSQKPQAAEGARLSDLQVVIDFDLGSTMVPLAELETWQAGAVVPLNPPSRADGVEVTIRANGQVIGAGELVRIDDRVAVRLTRLLFAP